MDDLGFGASKSSEESQQRVDVPQWMMPFVQQLTGGASGAIGNLTDLAGRNNVAGFGQDQLDAFSGMRDFASGADGVLPASLQALMGLTSGESAIDPALAARMGGQNFNLGDSINEARDALSFTEQPGARAGLNATAGGDFLFGGDGFNAAVDAAVRRAQPAIMSAFGGDAASVDSGLSRSAIGQSAIDAFASQYGQERGRQTQAQQFLEQSGQQDRSRYLGFGEGAANRATAGDQLLAQLQDRGAGRSLQAAQALPGIGNIGSEMLLQIGNMMQGQQQREIDRPMQDQQMLLQALFQGLDLSDFLGASGEGTATNFAVGSQ